MGLFIMGRGRSNTWISHVGKTPPKMGSNTNRRGKNQPVGMTAMERSGRNRQPRLPENESKEHFFDGTPEDATSVAKGRFFIESSDGIFRHTLFEKSYRLINKGCRYEKMSAPDNVCAATEGNSAGEVTVVCTKEQVKTVDVSKNRVDEPEFVGWTFAVFEEIYFEEHNKTIWHFNRSLWKAYNEARAVSVCPRPLPNNYKKIRCIFYETGKGEECPNNPCTFAHGPEELEKYSRECQYGINCLNKDHNCPYAHPLEDKMKEAVAEEAGPNYKTKMCERYKRNACAFGPRCWFAHGEEELRREDCKLGALCPKMLTTCPSLHPEVVNSNNEEAVFKKTRKKSVTDDDEDNELSDGGTATTISEDDNLNNNNNIVNNNINNETSFRKTKLCTRFAKGNCPYQDNCDFAHGEDDLRKVPCMFGPKCKYGPKSNKKRTCWYLHTEEEEEDNSGSSDSCPASPSPASPASPYKLPPSYRMTMCRNFANGSCQYGERCYFAHGKHQLRTDVIECEFGADCPFRQRCQYSHPETKVTMEEMIEEGQKRRGNRSGKISSARCF